MVPFGSQAPSAMLPGQAPPLGAAPIKAQRTDRWGARVLQRSHPGKRQQNPSEQHLEHFNYLNQRESGPNPCGHWTQYARGQMVQLTWQAFVPLTGPRDAFTTGCRPQTEEETEIDRFVHRALPRYGPAEAGILDPPGACHCHNGT